MRLLSVVGLFLIMLGVSSCAQMTVGEVRVHGLLSMPRVEDIRAVIAANPTHEKIYEIQVVSGSEMHVYYQPIAQSPGYAIVQRISGRWRYMEKVFFTS
jgi:hypothetical protein